MIIFHIPNPTQYLKWTTTILLIHSKLGVLVLSISGISIIEAKVLVNVLLMPRIRP